MKIGILGAGQLGRMLALAGYPLGFEFVFLDPSAEACAGALGTHLRADYSDQTALAQFCAQCELVTYEFENVPAETAQYVASRRPIFPPVPALTAGQDRLSEKMLFTELGIPVPRFVPVATRDALTLAVRALGLPAMLKTRRMGYDGKGQILLKSAADLDPAWAQLGSQPLIVESFVRFDREVSVLAVRSPSGQEAFYPLVENVHREGILRTARPRSDDPLQVRAEDYARRVLRKLDYVGVLAFEFFASQGELLANEIAPRIHNSGHWSIEGAECSQFENHLRAICNLPLGGVQLREPCAMVNFVGAVPRLDILAALPGVHIHVYGKAAKPRRKVGHATVLAHNEPELDAALQRLYVMATEAEVGK